ncbi:predicted protein [Uncinocarpus reesii 1704]|uniref:Uncharacterized protein n=1 Tax=Uncinocarpus reesii (strain UAMH 1704) TaxID=336963 RepID=C4JN26_UNCRE|nr:uncharacterized protein UREG_04234 [Uncinocarpus reesii 1704]EEP79388.1 predicted protein [Uncinocarpus reesii 1704]
MDPSKTRITPNSFLTKVGSSKDGDPIIVYFIPGNPGVVSYYHYFLSLVASNLSSSSSASDAFASLASAELEKRTGAGAANSAPESSSSSSTRSEQHVNSSSDEGRRKFKIMRRRSSKKVKRNDGGHPHDDEKSDHKSLSSRKDELWKCHPNTNSEESFLITGRSLAGFEIDDGASYISSYLLSTFSATDEIHSLRDQVEFVESNLGKFVRRYQDKITAAATAVAVAAGQKKDAVNIRRPRPKVILLGHSMGAYISMEILRRRRERELKRAAETREAGMSSDSHSGGDGEVEMDIIGALMLFPAVVDIAKSPSGKKMTTLGYIPYLDILTSLAMKGLMSATPAPVLRRWVRHVMKDPPDDALDTTIAFLKSRTGIRQALHLAAEEMEQIGPDKWSDEIWGISEQHKPSHDVKSHLTKLVFYFGRNDHWVAEKTRDEVIQARSAKGGRGPKMLICDDGIEHGFCIRHNEIMADKVSGFIREIVDDYRAKK